MTMIQVMIHENITSSTINVIACSTWKGTVILMICHIIVNVQYSRYIITSLNLLWDSMLVI